MPVYEIDGNKYVVERIFEKNAEKTFLEILYEYFSISDIIEREEDIDDGSNEQRTDNSL